MNAKAQAKHDAGGVSNAKALGRDRPAFSMGLAVRKMKLQVREVIDVGVHEGTPFLYKSFPEASFLLVDPQKSGEALLKAKPKQYTYLNMGVSDKPGTLKLQENGAMSSFLERTPLTQAPLEDEYEVPVDTLDSIIQNHAKTDAIGVKLDVEGFEGRVLEGFVKEVERVKFVILEASILKRFYGALGFSELVSLMLQRGFHFYNFLNQTRLRAPRFYDVVFLRHDDPLFDRTKASPQH